MEHSTEFAALELTIKIMTQMYNNEIPIHIFSDLSKEFDNIDNTILIAKLEYYSVKVVDLGLARNYLPDRKQYVEIEEVKSNILNMVYPRAQF